MSFVNENDVCPAPVTLADACKRASRVGSSGPGWTRVYTRTVGGIQLIYAAIFGRWALECFHSLYWHLTTEGPFKGGYLRPYLDKEDLVIGTVLALLSLFGFVGGAKLLGLRPGGRRWEIAYLVTLTVLLVTFAALSVVRASGARTIFEDLTESVRFYLGFALPYLPFLFVSPPSGEPPLGGKATTSGHVVKDVRLGLLD